VRDIVREALAGRLPERYDVAPLPELWRYWFDRRVADMVRPGMQILDVGSGRAPAIPAQRRPDGVRYVGLDIDAGELAHAPSDAYDDQVVVDAVEFRPELEKRFDLVLSLFVFEHVRPLDAALENMHRYLRRGGTLIAQLAGGRSVHGIANRMMPHSLSRKVGYWATRNAHRAKGSVFPAHYHLCHPSALRDTLRDWSEVEIVPQFTGAQYFRWSRPATAVYLSYEELTYRRRMAGLATWYLVVARR
jgi:SAM-dependent methyltransferase